MELFISQNLENVRLTNSSVRSHPLVLNWTGSVMGISTVLKMTILMKRTALPPTVTIVQAHSLPVKITMSASMSHGNVTMIMTVKICLMKKAAVSLSL